MDLQNLAYALVQVAHNLGAASVVGGATAALWPSRPAAPARRRLAWLVLAGWTVQGVSGAGFGTVSYINYGAFPDLHGIAVAALLVKIACATTGFGLAAATLRWGDRWPEARNDAVWAGLVVVAVTALSAAAFLRWFA